MDKRDPEEEGEGRQEAIYQAAMLHNALALSVRDDLEVDDSGVEWWKFRVDNEEDCDQWVQALALDCDRGRLPTVCTAFASPHTES